MKLNDRLIDIWTFVIAFGLPLLVMLSAFLGWPLAVSYALVAVMIAAGRGERLVRSRLRRRR
jgi:hypothetical protein